MSLPPAVSIALSSLDSTRQKAFNAEYKKRRLSVVVGYLAWFLIGWHYLYLGKTGTQFAFWFTGGGCLVWWVVDFFRVSGMVREYNDDLARNLMAQHKAMAA